MVSGVRRATSLLALFAWLACSEPASDRASTRRATPRAPGAPPVRVDDHGCAEGVAALPARVQRGICYAHSWGRSGDRGYGSEVSRATLTELRALGSDWVSLTPFGFVRRLDDPDVRHVGDIRGGESDERMRREIAQAKALGFRVLLKPHIWVGSGEWVGRLDPGSDAGWERLGITYRAWILRYAELAEETGAEMLAIGVEMDSAIPRDPEWWRALVADIRRVYRGKLVYCANWNRVEDVRFWDTLDYVGVQFYAPLANDPEAPEPELRARLDRELDTLGELSQRVGRPVLFTEVGYKSIHATAVRPHAWPEELRADERVVDLDAQARAYVRFIDAIRDRDWVHGLYWWKWFTDPDTDEEGPDGFSPRGKPAQAVLRAAYGGCASGP